MKQSQKNILMYGGVGVALGVLLSLLSVSILRPEAFKSPQGDLLCIEKTVFDTEAAIPNTDVKVLYPKNGFYNMGAALSTTGSSEQDPHGKDILSPTGQGRSVLGSMQILPTKQPIVYEPASELNPFGEIFRGIGMTITVYKKKIPGDLESFIDRLKSDKDMDVRSEIDAGYWYPAGGQIYYIYRTGDDVSRWIALTFTNDTVVEIDFSDMIRGDSDSMALLRGYQPRLMQQALSRISFE